MEAFILVCLGIALVLVITLGVNWIVWMLWCWAIPQIFPTAPENIQHPSFWLFFVVFLLIRFVFGNIFGSAKKSETK